MIAAWLPPLLALGLVPLRAPGRWAWVPPLAALAAALFAPSGVIRVSWLFLEAVWTIDPLGRLFLGLTAFLWAAAALQSPAYLRDDPGRARHDRFFLAAMAGNLGLVVAGDLVSFLSSFALMSFSTYGLVVHAGTPEAARAGRVYLALVLVGEVLLFTGLTLAVAGADDLSAGRVAAGVRLGAGGPLAGLVLFLGFGIKAGALPLHGWLPLAHPVAPAPASAVMSGAMIKAGLLGWLRFLPLGTAEGGGRLVMALGLGAALYAAVVGVLQTRPKAVLAYSSVSQMGLITVGVGAGLARPEAWPLLSAAVALYALHHGLAKGALFLGTAVLGRGGGRRTWGLLFLPGLALAGAPLTSGAVAKAGLKAALGPLGQGALGFLLALAAVGTTLLMARFLVQSRPAAGVAPAPARAGLLLPLWAVVAASLSAPWLLATPAVADKAAAVSSLPAQLWPLVAGLSLFALWGRRLPTSGPPRLPPGDYLILALDALWRHVDPAWIRRFTRDPGGATNLDDHRPDRA